MRLDGVGQLRTQMQRKLSFRTRGRQPRGDEALHLFKRRLFEVFQTIELLELEVSHPQWVGVVKPRVFTSVLTSVWTDLHLERSKN